MLKTNATFKNEDAVRDYVKRLGGFYKQLTMYGLVNTAMVLIWLLSGEGYFWPIWVMLGWGLPLFFVAVDLHLLPKGIQDVMNSFMETLPFLRPEWESEQVDRLLKKGIKKDTGKASDTVKKTTTKAEAALSSSFNEARSPKKKPELKTAVKKNSKKPKAKKASKSKKTVG